MQPQAAEPGARARKLEGKVALVSGAGRGIGRAIALKLASEGARVVVNDMDEAPAYETGAAIRALGGEMALCTGSVTEPDFGERFVRTALEQFGALDIIVINAGFRWDAEMQQWTVGDVVAGLLCVAEPQAGHGAGEDRVSEGRYCF